MAVSLTSPFLDATAPESRKAEEERWTVALHLIETTDDLPAAPPIAFKLLSLMRRTDYDNNDLVEVIRYDPELTAKLLKVCNSVAYRPTEPIMSIHEALLRLGQIVVYEQVLSISLGRLNKGHSSRGFYGVCPFDVWRRSVGSAIAARFLGPRCEGFKVDRETCFTVGLLHNIGQVVLNIAPVPDIAQISPLAEEKQISLIEAERQILGTDHAAVGGALLQRWNLPVDVVNGVRHYAEPNFDTTGLAHIAHLADFCSLVGNGAWQDMQTDKTAFVSEQAGLKPNDIQETLDHLKKEAAAIEAFVMVAM